MKTIIKTHNNKVINNFIKEEKKENNENEEKMCNCRVKSDCPLNGKCLAQNIIYKATTTHENQQKVYRTDNGKIQGQIQEPHQILQPQKILKRHRTLKVHMET